MSKEDYRPRYHYSVSKGWINDPNGFIRFKGRYHLFAQHYPNSPEWGPMRWLHLTSEDLLSFKEEGIALGPDEAYDRDQGCFSGGAIEKDGKLYLMYTGVAGGLQQQCLAVSEDGMSFQKLGCNPVIGKDQLPETYRPQDFRDPDVFFRDGNYFCLCAVGRKNGGSDIVAFRSKDLIQWSYLGVVVSSELLGITMFECPRLENVNGTDILFLSAIDCPEKGMNTQGTYALWGAFNSDTGHFDVQGYRRIDYGFDSYASQTLKGEDGRILFISWMDAWNCTYPTRKLGWVGQFTLPREVSFRDGILRMNPIGELDLREKDMKTCIDLSEAERISARFIDMTLKLNSSASGNLRFRAGDESFAIRLSRDHLTLDRSDTKMPIVTPEGDRDFTREVPLTEMPYHTLRIIVDGPLFEMFLDEGIADACACFYPEECRYTPVLEGFKEVEVELLKMVFEG